MTPLPFAPAAPWKTLRLRAELLRRVRAFFDGRDFLEVETPLLSADCVVDRHLDPIGVTLPDDPAVPEVGRKLWLQTSPEAGMKRLLAMCDAKHGDAEAPAAIYQITRSFRGGEAGPRHNPEFTIVEWYRLDDSMAEGMSLLSQLASELLGTDEAERLSYRDAFLQYAEIDPLTVEAAQLAGLAAANGVPAPASLGDDRDGWLDLLLTELVAPKLGRDRPTLLYDYPASQAALARIDEHDPRVSKRFELFYQGVELANGYWELLDAEELRRRTAEANSQRMADGRGELPAPEYLLAAMEHGLPACAGVALGFDRLVQLASGASSLAEVMAFPIDRA